MANGTTAYDLLLTRLREHGCTVVDRGDHGAASTPGHSPADRGTTFRRTADGVLVWVHNGDRDDVLAQIGLTMADLFDAERTEYQYSDGRRVTRYYEEGRKRFAQSGNKAGVSLFAVEHLPADPELPVHVVEGEKDVAAIVAVGGYAVSPPQGSSTPPTRFDWTPLYGRSVVVVRDMDDVGLAHALRVADLLASHADVSIVEPAAGADAADHIASGHSLDDFVELRVPPPDGVRSYADAVADWWGWQTAPPTQHRVVPTPWESLNEVISGGLHPRRTYVFAGRPGSGKTISVLNVAQHVAEQHRAPTLICSLEMPELEMASRLVAAGAGADYGQITSRTLNETHRRRVEIYLRSGRVADTELWLLDHASMTIEQIRAVAERMKDSVGLDLLAIDHIGLVKPSRSGVTRREVVAHASWSCTVMAKELDIPVIIASQLNRGPEQDGKRPAPSDLKESGDLEQNADVVALLHHPRFEGLPTGDVEIILGKNRTGPSPTIVTLPWRGHLARIG
ncbi:DnaB-like helicase C-terminal domain-containing protein [Nocardia puris]|uniref:DnaB helicase-like protein n=1 Tax=Nocardia puris TaxID=208602 RepID=A0A366DN64_9NOCA|nr:DnaB-like helicase C-terminal domain-containing protein [Nocardia puris]RBO91365.1 DnaB helicase-like protein [Nocardia puris]